MILMSGRDALIVNKLMKERHLYCRSCFDAISSKLTPGVLGERNLETTFQGFF